MPAKPVHSPRYRPIAALMGLLAVSLAAESALHLSGVVHEPGQSGETAAGTAEAIICVALLWGATVLARRGAAGRPVALGTTAFAIAGFGYGLSVTVGSGYAPDIAYHASVLPILVATFILIVRTRSVPAPSRPMTPLASATVTASGAGPGHSGRVSWSPLRDGAHSVGGEPG